MAGANNRNQERSQLWAEYDVELWRALSILKRQDKITWKEIEDLGDLHRKLIRKLGRIRELTAE